MSIQWGRIVSGLSQVRQAASDGFDFVQPVRDLSLNLGREQVPRHKARAHEDEIPLRVCALPLPEDVRVTQKGFNIYVWGEQLKKAAHRMAQLGCRKLVWSDGRARLLPVEGATAGFKEQVLQFLSLLCTAAADFGMSVLIEPLGPRRTNFLNTMKETGEFLSRLGMENLLISISLRELEQIGLAPSDLDDYVGRIGHVQMDNPRIYDGARVCPRPDDGYDYRPFIHTLREAGYSADISLPEDGDAEALAYCRGLWNE
jgi:sugar phosphate isomerase/epimerase